jgi:hypothetical protein
LPATYERGSGLLTDPRTPLPLRAWAVKGTKA